MGTGLISGTISREGCIGPAIKPTGSGKAVESAAEPEGGCVTVRAGRESETPTRGPLRSNEARLSKQRFFPAKRKGGDASHHPPFLLLPLCLFAPFFCCLPSPHSFAPCFGDRQRAQRWHNSELRPQRLEWPWPILHLPLWKLRHSSTGGELVSCVFQCAG